MRNAWIRWGTAVAAAALVALPAMADSFPTKTVRIVVPYPAGGATDNLARQVSTVLAEKTGQSFIVDNKPGGATVIAAQALIQAPPDGHTVAFFDPSTVAMNQFLFKRLAYDPTTSIVPVTQMVRIHFGLMVRADSPYKTLKEYVDAAKAKPGTITFGSSGAGNAVHLAGERFKGLAGIETAHIPYRGGAPAMQDLVGGQIPSVWMDLTSAMPFVKAGQVRVLAVASTKRSDALPDVPTFAESGYPGFTAGSWFGVFVPAGTPAPVIAQINGLFREAIANPKITSWLATVSLDPATGTAAEFANLIKSDTEAYGAVIKRIGFSLD